MVENPFSFIVLSPKEWAYKGVMDGANVTPFKNENSMSVQEGFWNIKSNSVNWYYYQIFLIILIQIFI